MAAFFFYGKRKMGDFLGCGARRIFSNSNLTSLCCVFIIAFSVRTSFFLYQLVRSSMTSWISNRKLGPGLVKIYNHANLACGSVLNWLVSSSWGTYFEWISDVISCLSSNRKITIKLVRYSNTKIMYVFSFNCHEI